jgi:hypothetical protein
MQRGAATERSRRGACEVAVRVTDKTCAVEGCGVEGHEGVCVVGRGHAGSAGVVIAGALRTTSAPG